MTTLYLRVDNATFVKVTKPATSEEVIFVIVILACLLVAVCITAIICLCILRAISKNNDSRALTPKAREPRFGNNKNKNQPPEPSKTNPEHSLFADVSVNLNDPYDDSPRIPPGLAFQPPSRSYSIDNYGASFGSSVGRVSESVASDPSHVAEGYDIDLSEHPSAATAYSGASVPQSSAATVDSGAALPFSLAGSAPAAPPPPSFTDADSEYVDHSFEPTLDTVLDMQNVSTRIPPSGDHTQLPGYH